MCVRLLSLFPLWTGAVSGPGVKFDGAQVSVLELLMYSRDTCGILVRDPGAKPVVPFALPVDVKFDCYDAVLVPEPGRCFESSPVVFSDPSWLAWLLGSTMVFPSGAGFHAMDCVSSLVLDASSSSWDCALPVLQPTARGYNQKDQKQIWKVKEGPYCLGFPCRSTGFVAAAAAAFTAAVQVYMEEAAAASLCAFNFPVIVLQVFWFMMCFDESGTEVVPSFLHGLLRDGHVLGLRFGRASAAAAFLLQFCSYTAAAFVGVITLVMVYELSDCDLTVGGQSRLASASSSCSLGHEPQRRDESSETCLGSWAEVEREAEEKVILDVNTDSFQLMVVTLTGRTLLISVHDDWTVHDLSLRLEKDTGIPCDAFFLTHGPRVLEPGSLGEMALSSSSVLRMRGRVRGGGPQGGPHGVPSIPGEWTCGNLWCQQVLACTHTLLSVWRGAQWGSFTSHIQVILIHVGLHILLQDGLGNRMHWDEAHFLVLPGSPRPFRQGKCRKRPGRRPTRHNQLRFRSSKR